MTRRELLKRVLLVPFIPRLRLTNRYTPQYGLFNPKKNLASQYQQSRMSIQFIQQWGIAPDRFVNRLDVKSL